MDSHCVVCGNYVPEGRTVCPQCEKGETMDKWTLQEEAFKRGYEKGKADAVVHGKWEIVCNVANGNCIGLCSNCKTPHKANNLTALMVGLRYCSWCGAKMDGGGNG